MTFKYRANWKRGQLLEGSTPIYKTIKRIRRSRDQKEKKENSDSGKKKEQNKHQKRKADDKDNGPHQSTSGVSVSKNVAENDDDDDDEPVLRKKTNVVFANMINPIGVT